MAIARRLRKAMIETAATASRHMRNHAIKHLSMRFVFVESVIQIRSQKAPALRNPKCNGPFDVALLQREFRNSAVLELRNGVADRCRSQANDRRILRLVHELIDFVLLEK